MAYTRHEYKINEELIASYLKDAVEKVRKEEDPDTLNELKKIFKKNVPFFLRGYVAGYLIKNIRIPFRFNSNQRNEETGYSRQERDVSAKKQRKFQTSEASSEPRERTPRVQLDPTLSTTIFIGVGRNRRVFPRDLVGLICSVSGIAREKIGDIRVLANYSFVQLLTEDAEKVINTLNEYEYRGRKLSVSFSKQKDDISENESEMKDDGVFTDEVPNVENVSAPVADSSAAATADTMAQQAAFAKQQLSSTAEMTDEEIMAARAPRSYSSEQ